MRALEFDVWIFSAMLAFDVCAFCVIFCLKALVSLDLSKYCIRPAMLHFYHALKPRNGWNEGGDRNAARIMTVRVQENANCQGRVLCTFEPRMLYHFPFPMLQRASNWLSNTARVEEVFHSTVPLFAPLRAHLIQMTSIHPLNHRSCTSSTPPQPSSSPTEQSHPCPSSIPSPAPSYPISPIPASSLGLL